MATMGKLVNTNRKPSNTDDWFDSILDEALRLPNKTQTELSIISGWEKIYRSLEREEHKEVLFNYIADGLNNPEFTEDFKRIQEWLPVFESLKGKGALEETMDVLVIFLKFQSERLKQQKEHSNHRQTDSGTIARREQMMLLPFILEDFMHKVEDIWHPASSEKAVIRQTKPKMDNAAKEVFNSNKDRIKKTIEDALKAIEKNTEDDDFKNAFSHIKRDSMISRLKDALKAIDSGNGAEIFKKAFIDFTNFYYEYNDGITVGGHQQEKREKRNEESRQKYSQAAKAMWKERKEKKRKG